MRADGQTGLVYFASRESGHGSRLFITLGAAFGPTWTRGVPCQDRSWTTKPPRLASHFLLHRSAAGVVRWAGMLPWRRSDVLVFLTRGGGSSTPRSRYTRS